MNPVPPRYGKVKYLACRYTSASTPGVKIMNHYIRVNIGFGTGPDHVVEETATHVLVGLKDNAAYTALPFTLVALQALLTAFINAMAAQQQGGPAATAVKNNARNALVDALRQLAGYVQSACNNDLATLLSSGFEAVSSNRTQHPLAQAVIATVTNGNSGQLLTTLKPVPGARNYEGRYAVVGAGGLLGPFQNIGLFSDSRSIPLNNLTPGTTYSLGFRAIGGSTGYGDWSDPISHMSL